MRVWRSVGGGAGSRTVDAGAPYSHHSFPPHDLCRANEKLMLERLVIKKGAFLDVSGTGEVRPAHP